MKNKLQNKKKCAWLRVNVLKNCYYTTSTKHLKKCKNLQKVAYFKLSDSQIFKVAGKAF